MQNTTRKSELRSLQRTECLSMFLLVFQSQFERGRRDAQSTMQFDFRNHAAVVQPALSSTSGAESEDFTFHEMPCLSCRC